MKPKRKNKIGGQGNPQWKKGQSGNPSGRPPLGESFTSLLRIYLAQPDDKFKDKSRMQCLVETAYAQSMLGNDSFFKTILERLEGRVPQAIEVPPGFIPPAQVHIYIPDNNRPVNGLS